MAVLAVHSLVGLFPLFLALLMELFGKCVIAVILQVISIVCDAKIRSISDTAMD